MRLGSYYYRREHTNKEIDRRVKDHSSKSSENLKPCSRAMYREMAKDCGSIFPSTERTGMCPKGISERGRDQRSKMVVTKGQEGTLIVKKREILDQTWEITIKMAQIGSLNEENTHCS